MTLDLTPQIIELCVSKTRPNLSHVGLFSLVREVRFFYFQSLKHVSSLGTGYYETPKVLAFALDGSSLVIEDTQLNEPGRCFPWLLFPSPPAVPAVLVSSTHGYLFARRLDELQTHTYTQDYLALLCICIFPPGLCLGPSGPLPCFPSATCVVTAKDSHLQPSPEKALGPSNCPTGRQMPANDPFHLSSGTRVSVSSRLLVWGRLLYKPSVMVSPLQPWLGLPLLACLRVFTHCGSAWNTVSPNHLSQFALHSRAMATSALSKKRKVFNLCLNA